MVCETCSRTDRVFRYFPVHEPVLWNHRIGWLDLILYLACASDLNDHLDV